MMSVPVINEQAVRDRLKRMRHEPRLAGGFSDERWLADA